jgi:hypothetical protein
MVSAVPHSSFYYVSSHERRTRPDPFSTFYFVSGFLGGSVVGVHRRMGGLVCRRGRRFLWMTFVGVWFLLPSPLAGKMLGMSCIWLWLVLPCILSMVVEASFSMEVSDDSIHIASLLVVFSYVVPSTGASVSCTLVCSCSCWGRMFVCRFCVSRDVRCSRFNAVCFVYCCLILI